MRFKKFISGLTSLALSLSAFAGAGLTRFADNTTANAAATDWKFDFGGGGTASGYTGVSAADTYDSGKGYGFTGSVSNVSASGSGALSDAVRFTGGTFSVDLPKGLYQVTVTTGDSPRTTINIEGMPQMMNLTGNNAVESIQIPVTDGKLEVAAVAGMNNAQYTISALEITQINTTGEMKPTVWICGDSTVANYYNTADTSQHGWGQYLKDYINTNVFEVRNQATSGQYAKGFVDAGQFKPIEAYGKAGDYYIISIGINDTNYSNADEYYTTVTSMVKTAKSKGMNVILVKQQGRHGDLNRNPKLGGRWFGGQLDTIASEQNVQVIDLFTAWQDFGIGIGGYDAMTEYYAANDDLHQSAKGAHITDVDGNEMIDYVCSWGPGILGHADPRVVEQVKKACDEGLTYGAPTEREVEMAELLAELVPSMEVSRLVSSGTEATMSAIRVARGYTRRDKIIKFRGCYHGHSDGLLVKAGSAALTTSVPDSAGVPADYTKNTLVAEYNNRESVRELFEANPDSIAAIIVEPVAANMGVVLPQDGFLAFLREITSEYGALLIFDEVITGFRLALGGAQQYFHVTPDLSTFGKIIGGGMPVGAYGGREDIMRMVSPDGPVYQAGTLSGNPIATAAGLATLRILQEDTGIYDRLEARAKELADAVREAAGERVSVNQIGSLMSIFFTGDAVTDYESATHSDTKQYADYFGYLLDRGIYVAPSQFEAMFLSDAHSKEDLECTIEVMREYFA